MTRLPETIDFDETAFPELTQIFHGIDAGIAAIIASDPAFRPRPAHKRRPSRDRKAGTAPRRPGRVQKKAA